LKQLSAWQDIAGDSLKDLTTQQRMISVEEAGLNARIAACDKFQREARSPAEREQLGIAKTMAQIDLVSLAAKRAVLEDLIAKGRKRSELQAEIARLDTPLRYGDRRTQAVESRLAAYRAAVEGKMPFAEVDGKIVIRRIRWDQPKPAPGGGGTSR
jgi:predicted  nucleic acid-binding Zn-ribbon protein